jgi:hypothetical protein
MGRLAVHCYASHDAINNKAGFWASGAVTGAPEVPHFERVHKGAEHGHVRVELNLPRTIEQYILVVAVVRQLLLQPLL